MNHRVKQEEKPISQTFVQLNIGDFFLFEKDLFVKTTDSYAICLARNRNPSFEQTCCFYEYSIVEKRDVTITVH